MTASDATVSELTVPVKVQVEGPVATPAGHHPGAGDHPGADDDPGADVEARAPRSRARRGEGGRLREDILAAAEQMLLASGDTRPLSIRAIAAAVGVTPPSIYLHFADRNELIFEVCDRQWRELVGKLDEAVAGLSDPLERIERRGRAYVEFGVTHPEHYRVLLGGRADQVPEAYADQHLLTERLGFGPLIADLGAAMDARQIERSDPGELCQVLFFAIHGLTEMLVNRPGVDWPSSGRLVDLMIATLVSGIRTRPS